eukprot:47964_1
MIESQDDFVRIRTMNGNSQSSTSMGESSAVRQLVSVACHDNPNPLAQCTHLVSALDCCVESIPSDRKGRVLSALKILKRTIESPHASQIVRTNANFPSVPSPVKSVILSFLEFHEKAAFRGVAKWAPPVATAAIHNTESISFVGTHPQEFSLFVSLVHQGLMRNLRRISIDSSDDQGIQSILVSCPKLEFLGWSVPLNFITTRQENLKEISYLGLPMHGDINVSLARNLPKLQILRVFLRSLDHQEQLAEMLIYLPNLWKLKFDGEIFSESLMYAACGIRNITKLSLGDIWVESLDLLLDNMPQKLTHLSFMFNHDADNDGVPFNTLRKLASALKTVRSLALHQNFESVDSYRITNMQGCECCPVEGPTQPNQSGLLCVCLNIPHILVVEALLQAASDGILSAVRHLSLTLSEYGHNDLNLPRMSMVFPNIVLFKYFGSVHGLIHHMFGLPKLRALSLAVSSEEGFQGNAQQARHLLRFVPEIFLKNTGGPDNEEFLLELFGDSSEFIQSKLRISDASMNLYTMISHCRWPQLTTLDISPKRMDRELIEQFVSVCPSLKRLDMPIAQLVELLSEEDLSGRVRRVLNFQRLRGFVDHVC